MAGNLDARAKLALTILLILIISSTEPGAWIAFAAYCLLAAAVAGVALVAPAKIAARLRLGTPFLLLAAALLLIAGEWARGGAMLLKGYLALTLLTVLVETTSTAALIGAIRRLGAPESVNLVAALMVRYVAMLQEEFGRMSRARLARAGGPLAGTALFEVHGNQIGLLLIRSWERAERIHQAMLARGFSGAMPDLHAHRLGAQDALAVGVVGGLFLAVRLGFPP